MNQWNTTPMADVLLPKKPRKDRIRELEAELQVRDNMGNEVLRILREATGKMDFHSEMEAAERAAKMLADARLDSARLDCVLKFMNDQRQFWLFLYLHKTRLQTTRGDADLDEWRKWIDEAIDAAMKEAK